MIGDGVTDDTAAINAAIQAGGNRCYENCVCAKYVMSLLYSSVVLTSL